MNIDYTEPWLIIPALLVAVFGAGRLARVITYDKFPPAAWARMVWDRITKDGAWSILAHCFWCATPWVMAVCLAWAWLSSLHWTWWLFWGWLGLSYIASMIVARDEPEH